MLGTRRRILQIYVTILSSILIFLLRRYLDRAPRRHRVEGRPARHVDDVPRVCGSRSRRYHRQYLCLVSATAATFARDRRRLTARHSAATNRVDVLDSCEHPGTDPSAAADDDERRSPACAPCTVLAMHTMTACLRSRRFRAPL